MSKTMAPTLFTIEPAADAETAKSLQLFNDALSRLHARRLPEIAIEGPLLKSKLAWKLATFQQAVLYRTVMLASGCALNWNAGNILCAYLASRALIETAAIFLTMEPEIEAALPKEDLGAIDALLMNRTFSTRNETLVGEYPNSKAVNILTLVGRLNKKGLEGVRQHYDSYRSDAIPTRPARRSFLDFATAKPTWPTTQTTMICRNTWITFSVARCFCRSWSR